MTVSLLRIRTLHCVLLCPSAVLLSVSLLSPSFGLPTSDHFKLALPSHPPVFPFHLSVFAIHFHFLSSSSPSYNFCFSLSLSLVFFTLSRSCYYSCRQSNLSLSPILLQQLGSKRLGSSPCLHPPTNNQPARIDTKSPIQRASLCKNPGTPAFPIPRTTSRCVWWWPPLSRPPYSAVSGIRRTHGATLILDCVLHLTGRV